jgi:hypothetical protein
MWRVICWLGLTAGAMWGNMVCSPLYAQQKRDTSWREVLRRDSLDQRWEEFADLYGELLAYNESYGPLFSWEELAMLPAYDSTAEGWLRSRAQLWRPEQRQPFVLKDLWKRGRHLLLFRAKAGNQGVWEPGGALFYRFSSSRRLQWGLTLEQDAQEPWGGKRRLVDFTSFHLQINDLGPVKRLVVGDYTARFGQGLVAWNGFSMGGLGPVDGLRFREQGLTAYAGSNEWLFFRGAGLSLAFGSVEASVFGSYKKVDARLTENGFTSLLRTGFHRTETEIERRHNLGEYVAGLNVQWRASWLKLGWTALGYHYDHPNATEIRPDNRYQSRRQPFGSMSIDGLAVLGGLRLFGELAMDARAQLAGLAGMQWRAGDALELGLLYRNYGKGYTAPFAGAYARGSKPFNEHAVLLSAEYSWGSWRLLGSGEYCYFPQPRYQIAAGSKAIAGRLQLSRAVWRTGQLLGKLDYKYSESGKQRPLISGHRLGLRLQLQYPLGADWSLSQRIEACVLGGDFHPAVLWENKGGAFLLDVVYQPARARLSGSARIAVFHTTGWNTRIYAYERDAMQGFSFPPIYGYGLRGYLNLRYRPAKDWDIWLRGALTRYLSDEHPSNSGKEKRSLWEPEVKIQVRWTW